MKIPTKFRLDLENYRIYFDNEKKTHVCEDIETGEKTNIGVIGTFLQMGILKAIEDSPDGSNNPDDRIAYLMDKVMSLEQRLNQSFQQAQQAKTIQKPREEALVPKRPKKLDIKEIQPKEPEEPDEMEEMEDLEPPKPRREPILKKHIKTDEDAQSPINQRVMEKILEKTIEEENKESPKDINLESEEEIDNWMEI